MADEVKLTTWVTVDGVRGRVMGTRETGEQGITAPVSEFLVDTQDGYARWYPFSAIQQMTVETRAKPEAATISPTIPVPVITPDVGTPSADEGNTLTALTPEQVAEVADDPASEQSTQVETETASEPEQTDDTGRTENADTPPAVANASAATEA